MHAPPDTLFFRTLAPAGGWDGGREAVSASQRARMFDAITHSVTDKGYARTTVADVVGLAGVSRRTFYEHFADKEACFLAAYEAGTDAVIADVVRGAAEDPGADWRERLAGAMRAYLATLAAEPEFARALLVDVLGAGPRAVELRQEVYDRFVAQWRMLAERASREDAAVVAVSEVTLRALVGGVAELVQHHVLTAGAESLGDLAPVLTQLAERVIESGGVAARPL